MTKLGTSRRSGTLALSAAVLLDAAFLGQSAAMAAGNAPALYIDQQAASGKTLYAQYCAMCHRMNLQGGSNGPPLAGTSMKILGEKTHLTIGDMFREVAWKMPLNAPGGLKPDQYVDITAFILKMNGYPAGSKALTYDEAMHSKQEMTSLEHAE